MPASKQRLTADDWLLAGFRSLTEHGPASLKAERLARDLGATKGSFYWHFTDVQDFHARMMHLWEQRAFDDITRAVDAAGPPTDRLYRLGKLASQDRGSHGGAGTEPAMRAWARSHAGVRAALQRIDAKRLDYLADILAELDLTNPDIARAIYGAYIGMGTLSESDGLDNSPAMSTLMAALLALQDA